MAINHDEHTPFWGNKLSFRKEPPAPSELLEEACRYFQWMDTHPLKEQVLFHYKGQVIPSTANKMRPYTLKGLATFLGVTEGTFRLWKNGSNEELAEVMEFIDQIIFTQKFEGAAANLLNGNIISRDLGLAEKRELTGKDGGPIETKETSARDILADRLSALSANLGADEGTDDSN